MEPPSLHKADVGSVSFWRVLRQKGLRPRELRRGQNADLRQRSQSFRMTWQQHLGIWAEGSEQQDCSASLPDAGGQSPNDSESPQAKFRAELVGCSQEDGVGGSQRIHSDVSHSLISRVARGPDGPRSALACIDEAHFAGACPAQHKHREFVARV